MEESVTLRSELLNLSCGHRVVLVNRRDDALDRVSFGKGVDDVLQEARWAAQEELRGCRWGRMGQWIGPAIAAVVTALSSFWLTKGGAEARLLRRAKESLELAGKVRSSASRRALHEAAETDIARALDLRATGRAARAVGSSAIVSTAFVLAIPWYASRPEVTRIPWEPTIWLVEWVVYLVLMTWSWIIFARLISKRSKALDRRVS